MADVSNVDFEICIEALEVIKAKVAKRMCYKNPDDAMGHVVSKFFQVLLYKKSKNVIISSKKKGLPVIHNQTLEDAETCAEVVKELRPEWNKKYGGVDNSIVNGIIINHIKKSKRKFILDSDFISHDYQYSGTRQIVNGGSQHHLGD